MLTENEIQKILSVVILPSGKRLPDSKMVSSIVLKDQAIGFVLNCTEEDFPFALELKEKCHKLLKEALKIDQISIVLTSGHDFDEKNYPLSKGLIKFKPLGVKKIIWVVSCKGGVGKSTITYLLAKELNAAGIKVGVLDADIYGPSMPKLFGKEEEITVKDNMICPFDVAGIEFVSLGNIIDADKAGIWRGPMVSKNIYQLLFKTNWHDRAILLVDMPPGTGDVALSLAETGKIDGAIMITTPSELAVIDNIRTIDMLEKLDIPLLGIVENMSYLKIGEIISRPFGAGGGEKLSKISSCSNLFTLPVEEDITNSKKQHLLSLAKIIINI